MCTNRKSSMFVKRKYLECNSPIPIPKQPKLDQEPEQVQSQSWLSLIQVNCETATQHSYSSSFANFPPHEHFHLGITPYSTLPRVLFSENCNYHKGTVQIQNQGTDISLFMAYNVCVDLAYIILHIFREICFCGSIFVCGKVDK